MKKYLLMIAAIASAATVSAQTLKMTASASDRLPINKSIQMKAVKESAPKTSYQNGLYYSAPVGSYFVGWNNQSRGYGYSLLMTPPNAEFTIEKSATAPATALWTINGRDASEDVNTDGNLDYAVGQLGFYYTPTLWNEARTDSFNLYHNSFYWRRQSKNYITYFANWDEAMTIKAADDHAAYLYDGTYYSPGAVWGYLEPSGNMFGTGYVEDEGVTYTSYATEQLFDKPMSPLYVESVVAQGSSTSGIPIAEGDTLWCYITKTQQRSSGIKVADMDNIIATLYAVSGDTIDFQTSGSRNTTPVTNYKQGKIVFTNKVKDAFGNDVAEPFVIDDEFVVRIEGYDNPNIDFGPYGILYPSEEGRRQGGYNEVADLTTGQGGYYGFQGNIVADIALNALFDYVDVPSQLSSSTATYSDCNILKVSDDGQTVTCQGTGLAYVYVFNQLPWASEEEIENYELAGLPEWVSDVQFEEITEEQDGEEYRVGQCLIAPVCEALPAGTTGRAAKVWIKGKGVQSAEALYILQGDATVADADATDGISNIVATSNNNNTIYNISGQKVGKEFKGIVIKNGVKSIQK